MHLFIFANFTAKIIKTFGLKLYYVLNFLHISTKSYFLWQPNRCVSIFNIKL